MQRRTTVELVPLGTRAHDCLGKSSCSSIQRWVCERYELDHRAGQFFIRGFS